MTNKKKVNKILYIILIFIIPICIVTFLHSETGITFFARLYANEICKTSEEYLKIKDYDRKDNVNVFIDWVQWYRSSSFVEYILYYKGFGSAATVKGIYYSRNNQIKSFQNTNNKFMYEDGKYYWYEDNGDNYEVIVPVVENIYYFEFGF